jgi:hypothetical protein
VDDVDLKSMLDAKAEEMHLERHMPRSVLRRARRRRAGNAVLAGAVTVGLALGAFVGARALLDETTSAPPEIRPGGTTEEVYPFIFPATLEQLEVTQEQVAQGSMPMWTEPEGVAILFAVNVMSWEMEDVQARVRGDEPITVVIANPSLSPDVENPSAVRTTLFVAPVPQTEPTMYAVLAAQAEGLELEPIGPEEEFGSGGTIGFRGSVPPFPVRVALTVDGGNPVFAPVSDGVFEVEAPAPKPLGPSTLISLAVLDRSRNTIALTSSRVATPVAGETETGTSEPQLALPPQVGETREAILAAARARDFQALRALIPEEGFTFSFGGETDPIAYWKRLESEGHVPVFGDILPMVLGTEPGFDRGVFVWPAQAAEDPADWDEADIEALTQIHAEEDVRSFQEAGLYLGWRVGIERDGTWVFFVSGD